MENFELLRFFLGVGLAYVLPPFASLNFVYVMILYILCIWVVLFLGLSY